MISSQPNRKDWDYTKSYTQWQGDIAPQPLDLPFVVSIDQQAAFRPINAPPGVPMDMVEWCRDNCEEPWAWWFDAAHAYIGFSTESEMVLFKLSCQ
jgi:hypothetical protein